MQQLEQTQLGQPAKQGATQGREASEYCQLQAEQAQGLASRQSQAAQQGTGVESTGGKAAGRQGYCYPGQQHRDQTGHVQVALGLAQSAADLSVAIASVLQSLVGCQCFADTAPVTGQGLGLAAPEVAVGDTAARLHHASGVEVGKVDQHARRQAVEITGTIRLESQNPAHAQGFHADIDSVTDLQVQRGQQPRLHPGFAWSGTATAGFAGIGLGGAA
ncbi:hypothetical protein D3C77_418010 [compost metagenome]